MTQHKPQPWYTKFNQPPRSPNGRNWKPNPTTHRDPADGTDTSPGGITWIPNATWQTLNIPISTGVDPAADDTRITFTYRFEKPIPLVIPYAGVRAGEIIGHRMWYVLSNLELCSLAHYFIWQPKTTVEGKVDEIIEKYLWGCIYGGVYSYAELDHIVKELNESNMKFPAVLHFDTYPLELYNIYGIAIGTVKCWGEVIEHEKGWRAQYAKIQSLDSVVGLGNLTELRKKYNV